MDRKERFYEGATPVKMQESNMPVNMAAQAVTLSSNIEDCLRLAYELRDVSGYIEQKIAGPQPCPTNGIMENEEPCINTIVARIESVLKDARTVLTRLADSL